MFWLNFTRLCNNIGKSPNAVAAEIGISSGSITNYRKGNIPSPKILIKIADYFRVSPDSLLSEYEIDTKKSATKGDGNNEFANDDITSYISNIMSHLPMDKKIALATYAQNLLSQSTVPDALKGSE